MATLCEILVKKIEVLDDGNPTGPVHLQCALNCQQLELGYFHSRRVANTGDVTPSRPFFFEPLHRHVNLPTSPHLRFELNINANPAYVGSGIGWPNQWFFNATAHIDIDLNSVGTKTTWVIETHATSATGLAKVRIHFDMVKHSNAMPGTSPNVWGFKDSNGQGAAVNLTARERYTPDEYPDTSGTHSQVVLYPGVWRTDTHQLGAVGDDAMSSLIGNRLGGFSYYLAVLYEKSFEAHRSSPGRKEAVVLGAASSSSQYHRAASWVRNLSAGRIMRWPPAPSMNDRISAVEIGIVQHLSRPPH